jgi:hypothetical protein
MTTNTCASGITYNSVEDLLSEPFLQIRTNKAKTMFDEGKSEKWPNCPESGELCGWRTWIDHAAAQEFIDFVLLNAPTYNVTIVSSQIVDL